MKKCVIITTINPPTETIRRHMDNNDYDVIIVGDKKTSDCYFKEKCIYLDINIQDEMFPVISKLIPYNHYARKNIGYLYAIKNNYTIIYETDDDNIPYDRFDSAINNNITKMIEDETCEWINIFKYFTNNSWIWPRGYPLSLIQKNQTPQFRIDDSVDKTPSIINGLVENDPDVDAIFRLSSNINIKINWLENKRIIVSNKNMCVFNTQNTFWIDSDIYFLLLLPCSVSFRYCDILKSIIANIILRKKNKNIAFISPNVYQLRNEHDLIKDFQSEYSMYINNENILDFISNGIDTIDLHNDKALLKTIYNNLFEKKIITELDIQICEEWLKYF
jgi:hypothetical protein